MGKKDVKRKSYLSDNNRAADLINGFLFQGKQVVKPEDVSEADSAVFGEIESLFGKESVLGCRDIFRSISMGF